MSVSTFRCTSCEARAELQPDCRACAGTGQPLTIEWCSAPWNQIAPNLWLGGHDWRDPESTEKYEGFMSPCETTTEDLARAGFDVVISFYSRLGCEPPAGAEHHHHRIPDGELGDHDLQRVKELAQLAVRRVQVGKKVLIRCQAGLNRASLCAAFALIKLGFEAREAIFHIREQRSPDALFNGAFVDYILQELPVTDFEPITTDADSGAIVASDVPLDGLIMPVDSSLTMNTYQQRAGTTAMYPERGTGSQIALAYCALGLGEVGEVQGKVKKVIRDADGVVSDEAREAIVGELGDCLWYIAMLADELDVSLGEVAHHNLQKLASRKHRGVITGSGDNR